MRPGAVLRVLEREWLVYRRLWRGLAFTMFGQPVMYLVAMGVGLGALVDANSASVGGVGYLDFVAPGLMVASAVQLASVEALWPVLMGVMWMRFYEGMMATTVEPDELYVGVVVWTAGKAMLGASVYLLVATALGAVSSPLGVLAIPATGLCAAAFAAPLAAFAIGRESDVSFTFLLRVLVLPLFLFSGTFFPVDEMPTVLERLAVCSPLWHGTELARAATTGSGSAPAVLGHVLFLVAFTGLAGWWGTRAFTRRLRS
ncbi:MAG: ABC transporter permease [Actinomycetota bacterium]